MYMAYIHLLESMAQKLHKKHGQLYLDNKTLITQFNTHVLCAIFSNYAFYKNEYVSLFPEKCVRIYLFI